MLLRHQAIKVQDVTRFHIVYLAASPHSAPNHPLQNGRYPIVVPPPPFTFCELWCSRNLSHMACHTQFNKCHQIMHLIKRPIHGSRYFCRSWTPPPTGKAERNGWAMHLKTLIMPMSRAPKSLSFFTIGVNLLCHPKSIANSPQKNQTRKSSSSRGSSMLPVTIPV
jgi:hypothetical protein